MNTTSLRWFMTEVLCVLAVIDTVSLDDISQGDMVKRRANLTLCLRMIESGLTDDHVSFPDALKNKPEKVDAGPAVLVVSHQQTSKAVQAQVLINALRG